MQHQELHFQSERRSPPASFAVYVEGPPPKPVLSWNRVGLIPRCVKPEQHEGSSSDLTAYDASCLESLDACINGAHLAGDDTAKDVSVYLCDWFIGKVEGAHWVREPEPFGWSWFWVADGTQLDPFVTVTRCLESGEPIAVRFGEKGLALARDRRPPTPR